MSLDELKPFLKIGGVVIALAVFGVVATCTFGKSDSPLDECNAVRKDQINMCRSRMRACSGDEAAAKACRDKVLSDLK